jgi:hypothetical protein
MSHTSLKRLRPRRQESSKKPGSAPQLLLLYTSFAIAGSVVVDLEFSNSYFCLKKEVELRKHADPFSLSLALPITTICSIFLTNLCFSRGFNAFQYHAAVLLVRSQQPCYIQDIHILSFLVLWHVLYSGR